jgi:predicted metal-binding protein
LEKYIALAKDLNMIHAQLISSADIHFDIRTMLKCRWGCDDFMKKENIKCDDRGTTYQERVEIIRRYTHILLLDSHEARQLSRAVLEIERTAFLDGYYWASAICSCSLCNTCRVLNGETCPTPEKIRPCDELFGIDVYKTARGLGLPIDVLKERHDIQNRYGFVLLD